MSHKGYFLIEIIMAVTVLAIITVSVCSLLTQSVYSNKKSEEIVIATALAQEKIEELKAMPFGIVKTKINQLNEECLEPNIGCFYRNTKIQVEDTNLLKIVVKVKGDNGVVEIATYKGKF